MPPLNSYPPPYRSRLVPRWPPGHRPGQTPPSLSSELIEQSPSTQAYLWAASQIGSVLRTLHSAYQEPCDYQTSPNVMIDWYVGGSREETESLLMILQQYVYFLRMI